MAEHAPERFRPRGFKNRPQASRQSAAYRKRHAWYDKAIWRKRIRPAKLKRDPLCVHCAKRNRIKAATEVDHIIPFGDDWQLFIDDENHQSLCKSCHSRKTAKENRR